VKGSTTAKADLSPAATGVATATFDSSYTPSANELLAAVVAYQSGTVGASNTITIAVSRSTNGSFVSPYNSAETGGVWTPVASVPSLAPVYADGYVGRRFCIASSFTNNTPTSASNPLYYGSTFMPALQCTCSGACVVLRAPTGASFKLSVFEGSNTTAIASTTYNPDLLEGTASNIQVLLVALPGFTMKAGTLYRFVVSMTTTTAFTSFLSATFANAADIQAYWGPLGGTTGSSGSLVWTDNSLVAYPVIPCIDTIAAASGGSSYPLIQPYDGVLGQ
jgi:hypothetical protein